MFKDFIKKLTLSQFTLVQFSNTDTNLSLSLLIGDKEELFLLLKIRECVVHVGLMQVLSK